MNTEQKASPVLIALGLLTLVLLTVFLHSLPAAPATAPTPAIVHEKITSAVPEPSAADVTVARLIAAYRDNEVRADEIYKGKRVRTSGMVTEISKELGGAPFVILSADPGLQIPALQCLFSAPSVPRVSLLNKGQRIVVSCIVRGLMMHIQMRDCVIL